MPSKDTKYRINGVLLSNQTAAGLVPSSHSITYGERTKHKTIGGTLMIEPPGGGTRTHHWHYDQRSSEALYQLEAIIGDNPVVYITTYEMTQRPDGTFPIISNLKVLYEGPQVIKTMGRRDRIEGFTLTWTEVAAG